MKNISQMKDSGSVQGFEKNWQRKEEAQYNHFVRGRIVNQIQFAFRQHWYFIKNVIKIPACGNSLEVGCGRGSISSYFAESGYKVTMLDVSHTILKTAKKIYLRNRHLVRSSFLVANALKLPFDANSFDVVISMGLLEHFKNPKRIICEQMRVLKRNGLFISYVVPERYNIQKIFMPLNAFLKKNATLFTDNFSAYRQKKYVYRSRYDSRYYANILKSMRLRGITATGVYPLPAISYSSEFPFTLMPHQIEMAIVDVYKNYFRFLSAKGVNPWVCEESLGQGFFIWGKK